MKPHNPDIVILEPLEAQEEKLSSGVILAANRTSAPPVGRVTGVHPQTRGLSPGEVVIYNKYAAMPLNGKLVVSVDQILAKVEREDG